MAEKTLLSLSDEELRIKAAKYARACVWMRSRKPIDIDKRESPPKERYGSVLVPAVYAHPEFVFIIEGLDSREVTEPSKGDLISFHEDISDYPNDIAAAWELINEIRRQGGQVELYVGTKVEKESPGNPPWSEWTIKGGAGCHIYWPHAKNKRDRQAVGSEDSERYSIPRAITRAFIMAMEQD